MRAPTWGEIATWTVLCVVIALVGIRIGPLVAECSTEPLPAECAPPSEPFPLIPLLIVLIITGAFLMAVYVVIQRHYGPGVRDGPPRE